MNQEQIYAELTKIFRDVFQDDNISVTAATTAEDVAGWDSSAHVNLILAIEMELSVVLILAKSMKCAPLKTLPRLLSGS